MDPRTHGALRDRLREAVGAPGASALPADLAAHVSECRECMESAEKDRALVARLRSAPRASAPADLADRIFAASLTIGERRRSASRRRFLRWIGVGVPLAAAAAVALLVLLREERPRPLEIVFVEVPFEQMQKDSPFSPSIWQEAARKARG